MVRDDDGDNEGEQSYQLQLCDNSQLLFPEQRCNFAGKEAIKIDEVAVNERCLS
jgi:hypothetical protein